MKMIKWVVLTILLSCSLTIFADRTSEAVPAPWFTGPLLAPSGTTYAVGHIGFQPYLYYTDSFGQYNSRWKRESQLNTHTLNPVMVISIGLTPRTDLHISLPYLINFRHGASDHGFGDVSLLLGYQVLRDIPHTWVPDIKLTIAEAFPTGHYENLNSSLNGTDSFGAGSYQTALGLDFQKRWYFGHDHFLRSRWNVTYTIPTHVNLHGFNAYGGAANTNGTIDLGNHFSTDLAFEYTLTRHWAPAIDFLYQSTSASSFSGYPGTTNLGLLAPIATDSSRSFSVAPAIEYNFNSKVGVIAGVWFTVTGRSTTDFFSGVLSVSVDLGT